MENEMSMPEVVHLTLEKMRAAVLNDPQILLEGWGGPHEQQGEYVFADVYGFEDELLYEFVRLPAALPIYRTPIRERLSITTTDDYSGWPRIAEHELRSGFARANIDWSYLPEWRHDDRFLVNLLYVRYKRVR